MWLLDSHISLKELKEAALAMQMNKSTGLDGILPEFSCCILE